MTTPRWALRWYWSVRLSLRFLRGRWFIFRDAPEWICVEYVGLSDHENPGLREMSMLAFEELKSRIRVIERRIERDET